MLRYTGVYLYTSLKEERKEKYKRKERNFIYFVHRKFTSRVLTFMPGCDILYVSPQKKGCVNNGKM